ncbi:MAG: O-methyltransferase [bacterium]
MFHDVPQSLLERMKALELLDRQQREGAAPAAERLRQVPRETGMFIALAAASAPDGLCIEIGTSGGYSALWLALACRERGRRLVTFEVSAGKVVLARESFRMAGVEPWVRLVHGDARQHLEGYEGISFCFLDADKELYLDCYEKIVPRMVRGGVLVADNALSHKEALEDFLDRVVSDPRLDALVVPVGQGVVYGRKQ